MATSSSGDTLLRNPLARLTLKLRSKCALFALKMPVKLVLILIAYVLSVYDSQRLFDEAAPYKTHA